MSSEEMKIRDELEKDIETNLEEEIKDGIYHLALRLHRLYQHQKDKNNQLQEGKKNPTLSEVNINIKMEGGTKIEIKETKKEARMSPRPKTSSNSENVHGTLSNNAKKKFDWVKNLRSGPNPMYIKTENNAHKIKGNHKGRTINNQNLKVDNAKKNGTNDTQQEKASVELKKEVIELGWKY